MTGKAIVLAAGFGTRLRPLTATVPKPLLPVWGEEMLSRIVSALRAKGVSDIAVNCHYLAPKIVEWCERNGCKASVENEILGTGGAVNPLKGWIGRERFYLVNGDIVLDGAEEIDLEAALDSKPLAGTCNIAAALVTEEGPRTIEVEPESSLVTNWASFDAGADGTFTYCGFALLKPEILDYIRPDGFSTIIEAYEKAMMDGKFVKAVKSDRLMWTDAGTVESYIAVNESGEDNAFGDLPHVKAFGGKDVKFLGARGSDRAFFRCDKGIVVVYDDAKRGENAKYASHSKHLSENGVSVAKVIEERADLKALLMEDAGEIDLAAKAAKGGEEKFNAYVKAVEALAKFGGAKVPENAETAFGPQLWEWERNLFREHCLKTRFGMEMPEAAGAELENIARRLDAEPKALVHRDYQSTNVLFKDGEAMIIDYQGMREGPVAYDLASLLYDPYVRLSAKEREALAALYAKKSGMDATSVIEVLPFAAVQRLVQALGAYGRLASVGQAQFGKHVMPALENLLAAADEAGLDAIGALAEDLIAKEKAKWA